MNKIINLLKWSGALLLVCLGCSHDSASVQTESQATSSERQLIRKAIFEDMINSFSVEGRPPPTTFYLKLEPGETNLISHPYKGAKLKSSEECVNSKNGIVDKVTGARGIFLWVSDQFSIKNSTAGVYGGFVSREEVSWLFAVKRSGKEWSVLQRKQQGMGD